MMMLESNKQKMYYSLLDSEIPVYERDEDGNIIYQSYIDSDGNEIFFLDENGEKIPVETGDTELSYSDPVEFFGNIAMSGGESEAVEFGLDIGDYSAVLVMDKGTLPIDETSLIWHTTEPKMDKNGMIDEHSADYTIVKISPSLNVDKFVLKAVVK